MAAWLAPAGFVSDVVASRSVHHARAHRASAGEREERGRFLDALYRFSAPPSPSPSPSPSLSLSRRNLVGQGRSQSFFFPSTRLVSQSAPSSSSSSSSALSCSRSGFPSSSLSLLAPDSLSFVNILLLRRNAGQRRCATWHNGSTRQVSLLQRLLCHVCKAEGGDAGGGGGEAPGRRLTEIVSRKQQSVKRQLEALGPEGLQSRLVGVAVADRRGRLLDLIAEKRVEGRTTIVMEVARDSPQESPASVVERCARYVRWGAHAIALCTDEYASPDGLADLRAVCESVDVPVICKDWVIHPVQIAEVVEAGAASVTIVTAVVGEGVVPLFRYAMQVGLDPIIEVINLKELNGLAQMTVPLIGVNLSVALSLHLVGAREDVARSLIGQLPFGSASIVGVRTVDEARLMRIAGADAVVVRREAVKSLPRRMTTMSSSRDPLGHRRAGGDFFDRYPEEGQENEKIEKKEKEEEEEEEREDDETLLQRFLEQLEVAMSGDD